MSNVKAKSRLSNNQATIEQEAKPVYGVSRLKKSEIDEINPPIRCRSRLPNNSNIVQEAPIRSLPKTEKVIEQDFLNNEQIDIQNDENNANISSLSQKNMKNKAQNKKKRLKDLLPTKKDEKMTFWLKIARLAAIAFSFLVIAGTFAFLVMFFVFNKSLPNPANVQRQVGYSTKIYDRKGELLYDIYGDQRREAIAYDQMSEYLKQATIAIEDKDFYSHSGFDFLTIMRIPYYYLTQRRLVGGSTLTQQLVKNMLLTSEKTVTRKFKEMILSMQIESQFGKDEILHMYLNEAPYGGNLYGVGTASRAYFGKSAADVTIVEAAILAGLPQNPSQYGPFFNKKNQDGEYKWRARAQGVLRRMQEDSYISEAEHLAALDELQKMTFERKVSEIQAPHFVFYVKNLLSEMYGEDLAENGGFKVITTLDLALQNDVQTIVKEEADAIEKMDVSNGAALVMNPKNGEILAMVGSKDYFNKDIGGEFNMIVDGLRQPGSSIKPLTYLAYLQMGNTPETIIADVPTNFAENEQMKPYSPKSYDGKFRGPVTVRRALGNSLNVPAVKALANVGVENFMQLAYEVGIKDFEPTPERMKHLGLGLAVTLGGADTKMLDLTTAYSSFANGGKKVEPIGILKIEDQSGKVLYENKNVTGRQVFDVGAAYLINDILSDNTARSEAFGANSKLNAGPNIAVKTGTTNSLKDNWTVGWSENFIVDTWVGNNDATPMSGLVSGITGAAPMWRRIVGRMLELGYEAPEFTAPATITLEEMDDISGYYKHDEFPTKMAKIIKGTLPIGADPIHIKAKLCRGENKLATDAQIAAGEFDEKEYVVMTENDPVSKDGVNRWQEAINNWVGGADEKYRVPTEYCGSVSDIFVSIRGVENEKKYDESKIKVKVVGDSGAGIEKMELFVNGERRGEWQSGGEQEVELDLGNGRFELWAKVKSRDGGTKETGRIKIGTGGSDWKEAEAIPEPTPTPTPTLSPTPTPTPVPEASP